MSFSVLIIIWRLHSTWVGKKSQARCQIMRLNQRRTFSFSSEATNPSEKASFSITMIIDDNWSVSLEGGRWIGSLPSFFYIFPLLFSPVTPNHSQCVFLSVANVCVLVFDVMRGSRVQNPPLSWAIFFIWNANFWIFKPEGNYFPKAFIAFLQS